MADWQDEVNSYVDSQKNVALAQVDAAKAAAMADVNSAMADVTAAQNQVLANDRNLTQEFIGFKIGIQPAAYQTDKAGALVRDPLRGVNSTAPPAAPKKSIAPLIFVALAGAAYFVFKKKKRKK